MTCNILMVMHGHYAEALLKAAEMFICEHPPVDIIPVEPGDSLYELENQIRSYVTRHDQVLIITDMMAGTPNILCSRLLKDHAFALVCGTNLSMLIEVLNGENTQNPWDLGKLICEKGKEDIVFMNTLLKKENQQEE